MNKLHSGSVFLLRTRVYPRILHPSVANFPFFPFFSSFSTTTTTTTQTNKDASEITKPLTSSSDKLNPTPNHATQPTSTLDTPFVIHTLDQLKENVGCLSGVHTAFHF
ncbi:hypothetical protein HMI54_013007, partial [Coelomomyces lativittatus]